MGMVRFLVAFVSSLLVVMLLELTINNPFVISFLVATVIDILAARD